MSKPPVKEVSIASIWFTNIKNYTIKFSVNFAEIDFLPNTAFSSWYSLQDWLAQKKAKVISEDDEEPTDRTRDFANKLAKTKEGDIALRYIVSPNASGRSLSMDLTSLQVISGHNNSVYRS